jgi:hypothetical protein
MMRPLAAAVLASAVSACALDADDASVDTLLVPTSLELHWSEAFNAADDGLGAVVPIDVMVYDGVSGEPRGGASVELHLPPGVVALTEGELLRLEPDDCPDCVLFWDAYRDHYYAVVVEVADGRVARLRTDGEGLARAFLVIDTFAGNDGLFEPARVHVVGESADASVLLVPR